MSNKRNLYKKNKLIFSTLAVTLLLNGCSSIGKIENNAVSQLPKSDQRYTIKNYDKKHPSGDTLFLLAFSGGGTRAAALSYGVLEELNDTYYPQKNILSLLILLI